MQCTTFVFVMQKKREIQYSGRMIKPGVHKVQNVVNHFKAVLTLRVIVNINRIDCCFKHVIWENPIKHMLNPNATRVPDDAHKRLRHTSLKLCFFMRLK